MKLILHIGTEKTGTTTTQHWAAHNRDALARQGVKYGQVLGNNCHLKLHLWCLTPNRHDESFQRIKISSEAERRAFRERLPDEFAAEVREAKNSGCHTFLISNELCHSRLVNPDEVQRARQFLEPHFDEIEILCALRPQIDLAVSHISNVARASSPITKSYFDEIGPDFAYYNYKAFVERWSTVFGTETLRLVPMRRTPDFTAALAARAGIDPTDLQPPVRSNEALDIRVMAMTNAMKAEGMSESRRIEPFAYIPREVLKQLPCVERLQPGFEVARSVQARFEQTNRDLTSGRTDLVFADLEPDWTRYEGAGNLHLLEEPCVFSGELAALVQLFNQSIALAELHNEIIEAEQQLQFGHQVLARRRLNAALRLLDLLKKGGNQRIRRFEARTNALQKELDGSGGAGPRRERRRAGKELEGSVRAPRGERRRSGKEGEGAGRDSSRGERRRAEKEVEGGGHDAPRGERRRAEKSRQEKKRPLRPERPADAV